MIHFSRQDFPNDFLFGTATSAYQVEGHAYGGAGPTHWDTLRPLLTTWLMQKMALKPAIIIIV